MYTQEDVLTFIEEENVKFIKLAFFDVFGVQKNISIPPTELIRAFKEGISFDACAIAGFGNAAKSDLFLHPDPSTLCILPWRPMDGRVIRLYCDVCYPDGTIFQDDSRQILKQAIKQAANQGITVNFGAEVEFYLFKKIDEDPHTKIPFDHATYMDVPPKDQGEDIRREICFTLADMGIQTESSHHEEGPGQNEIDFKYSDGLQAADQASTFKWVVEMIADGNGLIADFGPKPLLAESGNGFHINLSLPDTPLLQNAFLAGILTHIKEMTVFFNPHKESYLRLGEKKAPSTITWSYENRSTLIRIPASKGKPRIEVRSPDPLANPYLCYALLIYAGLDGINRQLSLPEETDINLLSVSDEFLQTLPHLPASVDEALNLAKESKWLKQYVPEIYFDTYPKR